MKIQKKGNILKLLDRKLSKDTLTLDKMEGYDKFSILVKDDKNLQIEIIRNDNSKITRQYKYRKKNNIYLLKNQNVKPVLIPYVLGVFNVKKGDSRNGVHVIRLLFMGTNSR